MAWDPAQYLEFAGERLRPALDLVARIPLDAPVSIVDLGCGAGNVTRLLVQRWRDATITGVDNSPTMLARAREGTRDEPRFEWTEADLATWRPRVPVDLLFSNAALHWLDAHEALFPRLFDMVAPGGALAVQMPANHAAPSHTLLAEVVASARWRVHLAPLLRPAPVAPATAYFAMLAPQARAVDAWTTEYLHVLPAAKDDVHPVVAWTRATALTPFLAVLDASEQSAFIAEYAERIAQAYRPLPDGRVLFAFRRLFLVATRQGDRAGA